MALNETSITMDDDTLITRYLKGQMTPEEEKDFIDKLNGDPNLKSKAVAMARLVKAMSQVGREKDDVVINNFRNMEEDPINIARNACKPKQRKILFIPRKTFIAFSAAASILVCIFGGFRLYDNQQMSILGGEYLAYFPASEYARGAESVVTNELSSLFQAIEKKRDLQDVIVKLETLWDISRSDEFNDYTVYSPEIGWMLANAYIRDNNKSKAINILDILIKESEPESAMEVKATELKKKIEERKFF